MKTFATIFRIESRIALFRHIDSLFFGILIPVIITLIIGFVMGDKVVDGHPFMQTAFGALVTISICATGLMGFPMNIATLRDKKVLKRFRVTPVSPVVLLLAQVLGCFLLVIFSLIIIYAVCRVAFGYTIIGSAAAFFLAYLSVIIAIYGIGILLAGVARNLKMANLLTTIVFFPMLLFSGATIPYEVMPAGAQRVMDFLPLAQGIKMLKGISLGAGLGEYTPQLILMVGIGMVCVLLSIRFFRWT
ncbi:MAG: ABC transporter permease [Bacteroides sp.]|nr:ABC transporter permease [Bacteroides sp.]